MTPRVEVRPGGRLETECLARTLCAAGIDARVEGEPGTPDLVMQLVWPDLSVASAAARPSSTPLVLCPATPCGDRLLDATAEAWHAVDLVPADARPQELVATVERALRGDGRAPVWRRTALTTALTAREREIAMLLARGLSNGEIADRLAISRHTVRTHVQRLMVKAGSAHRVALATLVRSGALDEHPGGAR